MGRNARLRRQRRNETTNLRPSLFTPLDAIQVSPTSKPRSRPWWQKLLGKTNDLPEHSDATPSLSLNLRRFYEQYAVQIGAVAWEGYQTAGRGFVWVKEQESSFEAEFFPRRQAAALLAEQQVSESDQDTLTSLIKSYDPRSDLVLVFTDPDDRMSAAHLEKLQPNPAECYRRKQNANQGLSNVPEVATADQTNSLALSLSDHQNHSTDDQPQAKDAR